MKANEVIEKLEWLMERYGNLDCKDVDGKADIEMVAYFDDGEDNQAFIIL